MSDDRVVIFPGGGDGAGRCIGIVMRREASRSVGTIDLWIAPNGDAMRLDRAQLGANVILGS